MEFFENYFNDPEKQKEMAGKPWYIRYKHVLMLIGFWLLFGFVCFLLDR